MIIEALEVGAGKNRHMRYYLKNKAGGEQIAWFDSLYAAGVVKRYLEATPMQKEEQEAARAAIWEYDNKEAY